MQYEVNQKTKSSIKISQRILVGMRRPFGCKCGRISRFKLILTLSIFFPIQGLSQNIIGKGVDYAVWITHYDPRPHTSGHREALELILDSFNYMGTDYEWYAFGGGVGTIQKYYSPNPDSFEFTHDVFVTQNKIYLVFQNWLGDSLILVPFYDFTKQIGDTILIKTWHERQHDYVIRDTGRVRFINGELRYFYRAEAVGGYPKPITFVHGFGTLEFGFDHSNLDDFETGVDLMMACSNEQLLFKDGLKLTHQDSTCDWLRYVGLETVHEVVPIRIINPVGAELEILIMDDALPVKISVIDQKGKVLILETTHQRKWVLDNHFLHQGLYFIKVTCSNGDQIVRRMMR